MSENTTTYSADFAHFAGSYGAAEQRRCESRETATATAASRTSEMKTQAPATTSVASAAALALAQATAKQPATMSGAIAHLRAGGAVILPTDTVYGLGVAVDFARNPHELFALKRRAADKPVGWLVADEESLERYAARVPSIVREWARMFWPGGLTFILPASTHVPEAFRAPNGSIGLRMPKNDTALALIQAVGCPLATTSANISGQPSAVRFGELAPELLAAAPALRDDRPKTGVASTVVDCMGTQPRVVRQGDIVLPL